MWKLKRIVGKLKKLWYWFPVIWKDEDWDSFYILEILKHKLKSQSKYIEESDRHTRSQQDVRRMNLCISLIKKVQDDSYACEYFNFIEEEFRFEPCKDKEGFSKLLIDDISENLDEYFKKYPLIYKRVINGERKFSKGLNKDSKKHIAMDIAHINQDRAHKLLFKTMEKNILSWWD